MTILSFCVGLAFGFLFGMMLTVYLISRARMKEEEKIEVAY